jgi:ATP-binding cassette, subfamily B, bacterial
MVVACYRLYLKHNHIYMEKKPKKPSSIVQIFKPYLGIFTFSLIIILFANGLNLVLPKLIGNYIDIYQQNQALLTNQSYLLLGLLVLGIFVLATVQTVMTIYLSEKIARDLRNKMINKISKSSFSFVNNIGASELITTFGSDVNNVKSIASQGLVYFLTAIILLIGSCIMLLITNWFLALIAISILPIVIVLFGFIFGRISPLFKKSQLNLSQINQVVNESIFGSSLVRVLNSQKWEEEKFKKVNGTARDISLEIVTLFSLLIPCINLVSNLAVVVILYVGGRQIVDSSLTLGQFTSFITYFNLLITPIFILGFTSQSFSRGFVSYARIEKVLDAPDEAENGNHKAEIKGNIAVKDIDLDMGGRMVLQKINFEIKPGTRTAILGPTGAGKSQLFNLLIGLSQPTSGEVMIDGVALSDWDRDNLLSQIGLVFQDSLVFRGSIRENIVFSNLVSQENLNNAVYTSKLDEFVDALENGLETNISERGSTLSGGQKQRLMLARSLALRPKILLLDDFTARVDNQTEQEIWQRLKQNYPQITLVSITQKIDAVKDFDQIIVLMEGELVGVGTHEQLLKTNPEYQQIYSSQQTVEN